MIRLAFLGGQFCDKRKPGKIRSTAMASRAMALLAALAATIGLAAAGGWGVAQCGESDRDAMLDLAKDCRWGPFESKQSEVGSASKTCPDGCFCSDDLGNTTAPAQVGRKENCKSVQYDHNGKKLSATPGCEEVDGCRCFAELCAYDCDDIDGKSCLTQFDHDQDERSVIKKFFTAKNIAIFSGAGGGSLLLALCMCCLCCCLCRGRGKGSDDNGGF